MAGGAWFLIPKEHVEQYRKHPTADVVALYGRPDQINELPLIASEVVENPPPVGMDPDDVIDAIEAATAPLQLTDESGRPPNADEIAAFLRSSYQQTGSENELTAGVQYMTANTNDLAQTLAAWLASR